MINVEWWINKFIGKFFRSLLMDAGILAGAFGFLWFFYGAVVDRIFPTTVLESSPGILNPLANFFAVSDGNMLVLLFPCIPLCLVLLVHHHWGQLRWLVPILLGILIFDYVVGVVSAQKIHEHLSMNVDDYDKEWSGFFGWPDYVAHVSIVMSCGFVASLVAGLLYHALKGKVNPSTDIDVEESADIGIEE